MKTENSIAAEKFAKQMKAVINETEELLKLTAGQAGDKIQAVRSNIEGSINTAKLKLEELELSAVEKVKDAAKVTDQYVHENPWPSIGVAAGVGLIFGWLIGKK